MKRILFLAFSLYSLTAFSQADRNEYRVKFIEGNRLMEEKMYNEAIKVWLDLVAYDQFNANLNYKLGVSYLESAKNRKMSLPFLAAAAATPANPNYDIFNINDKTAPIEVHYEYGRALHLDYKLDQAIEQFEQFLKLAGAKHHLRHNAQRQIEKVNNAKVQLANPKKYTIENLGATINSEYADFSPVLSVDENAIFFTSRRLRPDSSNTNLIDPATGEYFEDIYVSYKNRQGDWQEPELLNINTEAHTATINVSADGQLLFIYIDKMGDGQILSSQLIGETWSEPQLLGSDINTPSWESHAAITADGNTLYFISDRSGGYGGRDIYRCVKLPNGNWSKSLALGPTINTPYDEDACFIHPDGKTLYFSSTGHNSMGGFDIFYSDMGEDGEWSKPINIGYPLNTVDDDVFFVTSADSRRAYYSSRQEGGYGEKDIYVVHLPESERSPCLTVLKGYVMTPAGTRIPESTTIYITDTQTGVTKQYKPRMRDGVFVAILPPCVDYNVDYRVNGKSIANEYINVPCETCFNEIQKELSLNPVDLTESAVRTISVGGIATTADGVTQVRQIEGTKTVLTTTDGATTHVTKAEMGTLVFDKFYRYNEKDIPLDEARFTIFMNDMAEMIKTYGSVTISIEGSASKVPTQTWKTNDILANKRAEDAKEKILKAIKQKGLDASKIKIADVNAIIQGPNYENDPVAGVKKYEPFQYIRITAK
jgi:tetratricopeptide (TPR) repeat protein